MINFSYSIIFPKTLHVCDFCYLACMVNVHLNIIHTDFDYSYFVILFLLYCLDIFYNEYITVCYVEATFQSRLKL